MQEDVHPLSEESEFLMDTDGDEFEAEIETSGKYMYIRMRHRKITVNI